MNNEAETLASLSRQFYFRSSSTAPACTEHSCAGWSEHEISWQDMSGFSFSLGTFRFWR